MACCFCLSADLCWRVRDPLYLGVVQARPTLRDPWTATHQASLSFTISQNLLKLMSTELMMPSSHLILCHRLLLLFSIFPNEPALPIRRPKDWSFSFSISPSSEYSRLISFRMDWFDFFAVQVSTEIKC